MSDSRPKNAPFFQTSSEAIRLIAAGGLGAKGVCAYLVLSGGVNGKSPQRGACTHGANSVSERAHMSRYEAEIVIGRLQGAGHIEPPPHPPTGKADTRWILKSLGNCDVALSQHFLARQKSPGHFAPGSLASICEHVKGNESTCRQNALLDVLLVFVHLHLEQNFALYAGVAPSVASERLLPVTGSEFSEGTQGVIDSKIPGWKLVTKRAPNGYPQLSKWFLAKALGDVPAWDGAPSLEERGQHALKQLAYLGLVYPAIVLWEADPIYPRTGELPEPEVTLYLRNAWTNHVEQHVQREMNAAVLASGTRDSADVFRESRGRYADYLERSHMYLAPAGKAERMVALNQLRARWWPHDRDTTSGLETDRRRVQEWRDTLTDLKYEAPDLQPLCGRLSIPENRGLATTNA